MRARRVHRRIVWLLAAAAFGAVAILGASSAAADEIDIAKISVDSSEWNSSTNSSEWN